LTESLLFTSINIDPEPVTKHELLGQVLRETEQIAESTTGTTQQEATAPAVSTRTNSNTRLQDTSTLFISSSPRVTVVPVPVVSVGTVAQKVVVQAQKVEVNTLWKEAQVARAARVWGSNCIDGKRLSFILFFDLFCCSCGVVG
jgi:hypothetical protein